MFLKSIRNRSFPLQNIFSPYLLKNNQNNYQQPNQFHTNAILCKAEDRKMMMASLPAKDEGTKGEKSIDIDSMIRNKADMFPDVNTPTKLFNGVPFNEVPVCCIKATPNNTIICFTDPKGKPQLLRSCGMEGFKNTRKGTNIAAQATAISVTMKALDRGFKQVRVQVRGLGPGRLSAIKGVQMAGLEIISITDTTPVSWNPPRPRKQRRL